MMLAGRALRQLAGQAARRIGPQRVALTAATTTTTSTTSTSHANNNAGQLFATVSQRHQSSSSSDSTSAIKPAKTGSQTTPATTTTPGDVELHETRPSRPLFYHDQMEWLDERLVRISRPTKNVMQSGTSYTNSWKIEFDSQPRDEYWLMGWTGTQDPMSNLTLTFPTKETAIAFCEQNKLQWFLEEQPERKVRRKSYADNFSWNKRTRLGSK